MKETKTTPKNIAFKLLSTWKTLAAIKKEAIDKIMNKIPGADLLESEVEKIHISPADTAKDLEDCEIFLDMELSLFINNVTIEQIVELIGPGDVKLIEAEGIDLYYIKYTTSYNFEFDGIEKRSTKGSFSGCRDI